MDVEFFVSNKPGYSCSELCIFVSTSFIVSNECYNTGIIRDTWTITITTGTKATVALTIEGNCFGKE